MANASPAGRALEILLVEDSPADAALIEEMVAGAPGRTCHIQQAAGLAEALAQVAERVPDAVLLDLNLPDSEGMATVTGWLQGSDVRPVIVLTGAYVSGAGETTGQEAIHHGAQDFLPKDDLTPELLTRTLDQAIERWKLEQEQRLMATAFHTGQATLITGADGTIERVNPAFTQITGYPADEAAGRNPLFLFQDDSEKGLYRRLLHAVREAGQWEGEVWLYRKDGALFPARVTVSAIADRRAEIAQFVVVFQDISEEKQEEESRRQLVEILEATPDWVAVFDQKGGLVYGNRALARHLGLTPEALTPEQSIDGLLPEASRSRLRNEGLPAAAEHGFWQGTTTLTGGDGGAIPVSQVILAHFDPEGKPVRYSAIMRPLDPAALGGESADSLSRQQLHEAAQAGAERMRRETLAPDFRRIPADSQGDTLLLAPETVRLFQAEGKYALAFTEDGQYLANFSLAELEARLGDLGFLRVHRSYLVNLYHVTRLRTLDGQTHLVLDTPAADLVPVSRRSLDSVRATLGLS
jgi:PAS domain S-box-containing protein